MPAKYAFYSSPEIQEKKFGIQDFGDFEPRYNINPSDRVPLVTTMPAKKLDFFYWGIIPEWSKNKSVSSKLTEVPAEDFMSKTSLKNALSSRRCAILMDGFYAWKPISKKRKIPYFIYLADKTPFLAAGIFEQSADEKLYTFRIITVPPNELMRDYEQRLPAILPVEDAATWLDKTTTPENCMALLQPLSAKKMSAHPVSPLINTRFDGPEVLQVTQPVDQFGNYTLFD